MQNEVSVDMLDRAIQVAVNAHRGQLDKAGQPYILHPIRVMMAMFTLEEKIVAILHDVVEDTDRTLEGLSVEFPPVIIKAIDALTHRDGENYEAYIYRINRVGGIAVRVKLSDLRDNMNKDRIPFPSERDVKRWEKYEKAYKVLTS